MTDVGALGANMTKTLQPKALSHFRRERGQSLAEFALVLPLFLLVIMAAVDFGWAFRSHITATNAVREGARLGITGVPEDLIKATVANKSSGVLTVEDVEVTNALGPSGQNITVTASFDYEFITPLGGILKTVSGGAIPSPLPLESTTVMRLE